MKQNSRRLSFSDYATIQPIQLSKPFAITFRIDPRPAISSFLQFSKSIAGTPTTIKILNFTAQKGFLTFTIDDLGRVTVNSTFDLNPYLDYSNFAGTDTPALSEYISIPRLQYIPIAFARLGSPAVISQLSQSFYTSDSVIPDGFILNTEGLGI